MRDFLFPVASTLVMGIYIASLFLLSLYGLHRYWTIFLYMRHRKKTVPPTLRTLPDLPKVTVQLPLFNEMYVAERLIDAVCNLDYPKEKLHIQVLDDSTDETVSVVQEKVLKMRASGFDIDHVRRESREGFKAGALSFGLKSAKGEFIAIFDADFIPPAEFLKGTIPYFQDGQVGMVQTRWGHLNDKYSLLTRLQALFLDGHFLLEHTARHQSGAFFNFNGTAGIWRKEAILSADDWSSRTLTEDMDLSFRAQLAGWKFVYVPHIVCPAELPVQIHAFLSQQKRWAKGAIQTAKFILKDLWKAKVPLLIKIEGTIHLTSNFGYLLALVLTLLLLPSLILFQGSSFAFVHVLEWMSLFFIASSISIFYAIAQKAIYPDWKWRLRDIPFLMAFGIGLCISNATAVLEGLFGRKSD
ncbi:MAG: glycosyltransferase family 2 protein, partial [Elusimicrobia bacterium]|nr:glycosyltransferase family 2 protein [Candidatus Obscuribacterium magneticum]